MPDTIGNIPVPEIPVAQNPVSIVPDYPYGRVLAPDVAIHQFGSGNAKIEQRFLLGTGVRRFLVRKAWLTDLDRMALRTFWEARQGAYGAFTYNAANDDGTMPVTCRFANEPLSWEMLTNHVCSLGVTLIELPSTTPAYTVDATATRVPPAALQTALLSQTQQVVPLMIQPLETGSCGDTCRTGDLLFHGARRPPDVCGQQGHGAQQLYAVIRA